MSLPVLAGNLAVFHIVPVLLDSSWNPPRVCVHRPWLLLAIIQAEQDLRSPRSESTWNLLTFGLELCILLNTVSLIGFIFRAWNLWPIEMKVKCQSYIPVPEINSPQSRATWSALFVRFISGVFHSKRLGLQIVTKFSDSPLLIHTHRAIINNLGNVLRLLDTW